LIRDLQGEHMARIEISLYAQPLHLPAQYVQAGEREPVVAEQGGGMPGVPAEGFGQSGPAFVRSFLYPDAVQIAVILRMA
jgi:hypothetical protein